MKFIDLEDPPVFEMIDYKNVLLNGKKVLICYLFFVHYGLFSLRNLYWKKIYNFVALEKLESTREAFCKISSTEKSVICSLKTICEKIINSLDV